MTMWMNDTQSNATPSTSAHDAEEAARGQSERELCELARARDTVAGYEPADVDQIAERDRILAFIDEHPDSLVRSCKLGHLTASGLLIDHAGERALLTLHRKLGRWLQLGGHVDGDGDLAAAALREAIEESGIDAIEVDPRIGRRYPHDPRARR